MLAPTAKQNIKMGNKIRKTEAGDRGSPLHKFLFVPAYNEHWIFPYKIPVLKKLPYVAVAIGLRLVLFAREGHILHPYGG